MKNYSKFILTSFLLIVLSSFAFMPYVGKINPKNTNQLTQITPELKKSLDSITKSEAQIYKSRMIGKVTDSDGSSYYFGYDGRTNAKINNFNQTIDIGSCTKLFTATSILQLVEKNKFSLDSRLVDLLPDRSLYDGLVTIDAKNYIEDVKLYNLLNHTSGLPDYFLKNDEQEIAIHGDSTLVFTPRQLISMAKRLNKPELKPGEKFNYSNVNYILLGLIIEKYSGMTYQKYIQKHILKPLSMKQTYFASLHYPKNRTEGHWNKKITQMPATLAFSAGEIISTLDNMEIFMRAWEKGKLFDNKEMSKRVKNEFFNDMGGGIKYGLGVINLRDLSYGHAGQTFGFSSYMGSLPNGYSFVLGCDDAMASAWVPALSFSSILSKLN